DVEPVEGDVPVGAEPPGEVVVSVEEQSRGMDAPGPLGDGRGSLAGIVGQADHGRCGTPDERYPQPEPASSPLHGPLLNLRFPWDPARIVRGRPSQGNRPGRGTEKNLVSTWPLPSCWV